MKFEYDIARENDRDTLVASESLQTLGAVTVDTAVQTLMPVIGADTVNGHKAPKDLLPVISEMRESADELYGRIRLSAPSLHTLLNLDVKYRRLLPYVDMGSQVFNDICLVPELSAKNWKALFKAIPGSPVSQPMIDNNTWHYPPVSMKNNQSHDIHTFEDDGTTWHIALPLLRKASIRSFSEDREFSPQSSREFSEVNKTDTTFENPRMPLVSTYLGMSALELWQRANYDNHPKYKETVVDINGRGQLGLAYINSHGTIVIRAAGRHNWEHKQ